MISASCGRPLNAWARASRYIKRGIFRRTSLDRPPRQVVKGPVIAPLRCGECQIPAAAPFDATAVSRRLELCRSCSRHAPPGESDHQNECGNRHDAADCIAHLVDASTTTRDRNHLMREERPIRRLFATRFALTRRDGRQPDPSLERFRTDLVLGAARGGATELCDGLDRLIDRCIFAGVFPSRLIEHRPGADRSLTD